ncbi:MAG: hypothetical protein LBI33_00360 [Propionibacteriaceae bacterium]|nr:hypothetical protein [Propionibacteriaceae bacterium]
MNDAVTMARTGLLDALGALEPHLNALVLIGAQAIYLRAGSIAVALAEYTTDADLAVDPDLLTAEPLIEDAMRQAGFTPDPRDSAVGTWISPGGVSVDLMVPDAVAGTGRRGVRVPPHGSKTMRRARGIEAALVDSSRMTITAFDPAVDSRAFVVAVAGPTALLVAKLHKLHDRIETPSRRDNKDAHDVYRLLRAIGAAAFVEGVDRLLSVPLSAPVTLDALSYLAGLFGRPDAPGSVLAGAAERMVGDPAAVAESVALLAQDLLSAKSYRPQ